MTGSPLLPVLKYLEQQSIIAMFRFNDGDMYSLRIISTMHAEEGGDAVAEVVMVASSLKISTVSSGQFINFLLADVVEVSLDGGILFTAVGTCP